MKGNSQKIFLLMILLLVIIISIYTTWMVIDSKFDKESNEKKEDIISESNEIVKENLVAESKIKINITS